MLRNSTVVCLLFVLGNLLIGYAGPPSKVSTVPLSFNSGWAPAQRIRQQAH